MGRNRWTFWWRVLFKWDYHNEHVRYDEHYSRIFFNIITWNFHQAIFCFFFPFVYFTFMHNSKFDMSNWNHVNWFILKWCMRKIQIKMTISFHRFGSTNMYSTVLIDCMFDRLNYNGKYFLCKIKLFSLTYSKWLHMKIVHW